MSTTLSSCGTETEAKEAAAERPSAGGYHLCGAIGASDVTLHDAAIRQNLRELGARPDVAAQAALARRTLENADLLSAWQPSERRMRPQEIWSPLADAARFELSEYFAACGIGLDGLPPERDAVSDALVEAAVLSSEDAEELMRAGLFSEACEVYLNVAAFAPASAFLLLRLAQCLAAIHGKGKLGHVLALLSAAVSIEPWNKHLLQWSETLLRLLRREPLEAGVVGDALADRQDPLRLGTLPASEGMLTALFKILEDASQEQDRESVGR
uniref:Uncharacterized protein n=1 Tax=Pinguiococcus pyrenoidosus TaxID=172671 RepID=A0A6U0VRK9_9STRA|mmetsp:Transcript_4840/g.19366  ORF Transcript_4840/g.19366 Transcript_4840/m.19366 type:complete len:270 (+) Transcript_4840:148-957(+)